MVTSLTNLHAGYIQCLRKAYEGEEIVVRIFMHCGTRLYRPQLTAPHPELSS